MTKEEKRNGIIWGILCLLSFILFAVGLSMRYNGYGKSGEIRKKLIPIAEQFNKLEEIKFSSFTKIHAEYKNKKIVVSYENKYVDTEFIFKYIEDENIALLTIDYNDEISTDAEIVVKNMVDAISMINGNYEGEVFSKYKYENFYNTTVKEGFSLKKENRIITANLAIDTDLLNNIKDMFFEGTNISYISYDDLKDLKNKLETEKEFSLTKENINIYVVEKDEEYIIYCSDKSDIENENNDTKNIYESVMSAVNILDQNAFSDMIKTNFNITKEIKRKNYELRLNPTNIENNKEMPGNFVIQLTLTKQLEEE